ncbi:MAG: histidinol-phosphate transaminase [Gammaproteobacteria bacterium]|nr:histidinol-phosphate transaminase [Gammaproteobacteria bacterium]
MSVAALARPEIAALSGYASPTADAGEIRLNANEAFCSPWADSHVAQLTRYPDMRPHSLRSMLCDLYGTATTNLLPVRGSSEALDLLIRSFCRAYQDSVLVPTPSFEMYRVYADIQGAAAIDLPLSAENAFAVDAARVLDACGEHTKLVFLCSPNNPTGNVIDRDTILEICRARQGQSLVVLDEAYIEFSDSTSLVSNGVRVDNLVILRTLSKAFALAGARCGAVIADSAVIGILEKVMSPYSFATPVVEQVCRALGGGQLQNTTRLINETRELRDQLFRALTPLRAVEKVWPSQGNFLLVRFRKLETAIAELARRKIRVRQFTGQSSLAGCARITVGSAEENAQLVAALRVLDITA